MSDKPQVGDRVKVSRTYDGSTEVTWTGTVTEVAGSRVKFYGYVFDLDNRNYTVEILERAKPKWQDGDVVQVRPGWDTSGELRFRVDGEWITPDGGYRDDRLDSEYKLVMRDGKPV